MSKKLEILYEYLQVFNANNCTNLAIDTIRVNFSKQHKLKRLNELGNWHKVTLSSKISSKLKKRLTVDEITSVYQFENTNIYYFNSQDRPSYRKATMVIFGLRQYNGKEVPYKTINEIIKILDNISNVDICYDFEYTPVLSSLNKRYKPLNYKGYNQTIYYNHSNNPLIEKFIIYNKALKNKLKGVLHRIEFKVLVHNIKDLYLPLDDIRDIISLIQKQPTKERLNAEGRDI